MAALIEFKNYSMGFQSRKGHVDNLLDHINFTIEEGKAVGIVGESGCGKSMTSLSIMGLLPEGVKVQGGEILFQGNDLLKKNRKEMQKIVGKDITMIFQEPMTSLNPVLTIEKQIGEVLKKHYPNLSNQEVHEKVIKELDAVGIANPEERAKQYPHQFSGGMRQRVMIAMAIICGPKLLIADEPTTALDVTIQAQVLDLMKSLKQNGSLMLITHNLGVVAQVCDEIVVMYAGRVVEKGTLKDVFDNPKHPYTQGLMKSIPTLDSVKEDLYTIPGMVPGIRDFPKGCRFAPRCDKVCPECMEQVPPIIQINEKHQVQCFLYNNDIINGKGGETVG
ncbi:ABC transporter ATP-binding protein [Anaerotignum faecicola]|nr:ABC transporter ATP-binding protein [Anaerotignum faecicola]